MADDQDTAERQVAGTRAAPGGQGKGRAPGRQKSRQPKPPTPEDLYKLQIADELGLGQKVRRVGWGGLSAAETGRIGGHMTKKARAAEKDEKET